MPHLNCYSTLIALLIALSWMSSRAAVSSSGLDLSEAQTYRADRYAERLYSRCAAIGRKLRNGASLKPHFYLIGKDNFELRVDLNVVSAAQLADAGYEPAKKTTILVHGFTQGYKNTPWLADIVALYRRHSHLSVSNLLVMDWSVGSHLAYPDAAASLGYMGENLANFIEFLVDEMGADRQAFHVIGHSLGAHLSGYAGEILSQPIGRITGLDPAGPCFTKVLNLRPEDYLDWHDAKEVAIYHYDDGFLGMPGVHGTTDIFVNGGQRQPDSPPNLLDNFIRAVAEPTHRIAQSHSRSTDVTGIALSVTGCQQVAYECSSYESYLRGECGKCDAHNNQCFLMGFDFQYLASQAPPDTALVNNSKRRRRMYISTGVDKSFCRHHYQVLVRFPASTKLAPSTEITLNLTNERGEVTSLQLYNRLQPGLFSHLIALTPLKKPSKFVSALLQVRQASGSVDLIPMKVMVEVNYMSNIDHEVRLAFSSILRPARLISDSGEFSRAGSGSIQPTRGKWFEFKLSPESPA